MEHLSIRQGLCVRYFDEDEITIDQFFDSVSSKNDTSLQPLFLKIFTRLRRGHTTHS